MVSAGGAEEAIEKSSDLRKAAKDRTQELTGGVFCQQIADSGVGTPVA